jgi:hypothetical protein
MIRTRISVPTRLDQARDAIELIQQVLSELARRELSEEQAKALGGISDDLRALSGFARVCAAIGRIDHDEPHN